MSVQNSTNEREALVTKHAPLVKTIAGRLALRLPQHIRQDDLTSAGLMGLLDAIDKFDIEKGVEFKSYAEFRIKGAMIDELRSMDWVPRSVRKNAKMLTEAYARVENREMRPAQDEEVAEELGMEMEAFYRLLDESRGISIFNEYDMQNDKSKLNELEIIKSEYSPDYYLEKKECSEFIKRIIEWLPEKEKTVCSLYYYEELTMKEIGVVMGYTESRISQLYTKAILRLRKKIKNFDKIIKIGDKDMGKEKNNKTVKRDGKTYKICYVCNEEKELNKENFIPNSLVMGGYENQCRKCKNKKTKERNNRKNQTKEPQQETNPIINQSKKEFSINLDLTEIINKHPDLYKKLAEQAKNELRPIENHALWLIKMALDIELETVFK